MKWKVLCLYGDSRAVCMCHRMEKVIASLTSAFTCKLWGA